MPKTYSQVYLQFIFAVKYRRTLIQKEHKEEIQKYITGLVQRRNTRMMAISCMPDHIHMFVGYKPTTYIPDLIKEIKVESNQFINDRRLTAEQFSWQEGYGVFSYSHSQIDSVVKYILNQEAHHKKKTFREEYYELLKNFDVPFEERYLFDFFD